ncbi:MAG: DUF1653 domain-containing protein [Rikenellaceae bacterium]
MERTIKLGQIYKHFKGGLYLTLLLGYDHETREPLVVYKQLASGHNFVRPLDMFLSEVERSKYPEAKQHFRMEEFNMKGDQ